MSDHQAAKPRPTVEPTVQCIFIHFLSFHKGEAAEKLVDAWDKREELLWTHQETQWSLWHNLPQPGPYQRRGIFQSILMRLTLYLPAMQHLAVGRRSRWGRIRSPLVILPGGVRHRCETEVHLVEESNAVACQTRPRGMQGYLEKVARVVRGF